MGEKPTLTKNGDIYGCSACKDWTVTMDTRPEKRKRTPAERQAQAHRYFADHLKRIHTTTSEP